MKSTKYLDDLSKLTGMNDTELAKMLSITQPAMSNLKAGRRIMENETAIAVALALQVDPIKVIMAADIDRAERHGQKSLWEVFIQRTAQATSAALSVLAVAIFVILFLTNTDVHAATSKATSYTNHAEYKLCEVTSPPGQDSLGNTDMV